MDQLPQDTFQNDATHNAVTCVYIGGVIDHLEERYVPVEQRQYTDEKVCAKIVAFLEKSTVEGVYFTETQQDYFISFAIRKQDEFDSAIITKNGAKKTVDLSMNKLVYLLLCALEADHDFKFCINFKQRAEKLLGWLANTMLRKQVCNVGRRNDCVGALLDKDYLLEKEPARCVEIIYDQCAYLCDQLTEFLKKRWEDLYKKNPRVASKILFEWVTGEDQGHFATFIKTGGVKGNKNNKQVFRTLMIDYLEGCVKDSFTALEQWEKPIQDTLKAMDLIGCPDIENFRTQLQALREVYTFIVTLSATDKSEMGFGKRAKDYLKKEYIDIATFISPKTKAFSVLERLYQQALPYRGMFPIGKAEQFFLAQAHAVIQLCEHEDLLPWFLGQAKAQCPFSQFVNPEVVEAFEREFSEAKSGYRSGIDGEIENSFAVLKDAEWEDREVLFDVYKKKIVDKWRFDNEDALEAWHRQFVEIRSEDNGAAITLTPLAVNKIIWQGLLTCPSQWSFSFSWAFEQVIALLEKEGDVISDLHRLNRRSSYPDKFMKQLKWLLSIAKDQTHDFDMSKVPVLYLPCYIASCAVSNPSNKNFEGRTVLHWAAANGHIEFLTALLRLEVVCAETLSQGNIHGRTALMLAARGGEIGAVKALLASEKVSAEAVCQADNFGNTALLLASWAGRTEVVKVLLGSEKVSAEAVNQKDELGQNALMLAALEGQVEVVKALLASEKMSEGAVNQRDNQGNTALLLAAKGGHAEIVKVLTLPALRAYCDSLTTVGSDLQQQRDSVRGLIAMSNELIRDKLCIRLIIETLVSLIKNRDFDNALKVELLQACGLERFFTTEPFRPKAVSWKLGFFGAFRESMASFFGGVKEYSVEVAEVYLLITKEDFDFEGLQDRIQSGTFSNADKMVIEVLNKFQDDNLGAGASLVLELLTSTGVVFDSLPPGNLFCTQ